MMGTNEEEDSAAKSASFQNDKATILDLEAKLARITSEKDDLTRQNKRLKQQLNLKMLENTDMKRIIERQKN